MIGEYKRGSILRGFGKPQYISTIPTIIKALKPKFDSEIEKSHISEALVGGGSNVVDFVKTGAEIRAKIASNKEREGNESKEYLTDAKALLFDIQKDNPKCEPSEEINEWLFRGTKPKFTEIPKLFDWKAIEMNGKRAKDYNDLIVKYVGCGSEVFLLETLDANLKDEVSYSFNLYQLVALGF